MLPRQPTRLRSIVNLRTAIGVLVLAITSIFLFWLSTEITNYDEVVAAIASVILTSGVFSLVYEVLVRREQTRVIFEAFDIRESLRKTGFRRITVNNAEYDYTSKIENTEHLTIFALDGWSWLDTYESAIRSHLKQNNSALITCLPALNNPFLDVIANDFGDSVEEIRTKIAHSVSICVLAAINNDIGDESLVKVYFHKTRPVYSMYKFDDRLLVGTYYLDGTKPRAPMFEFINKSGSLFLEFSNDIDNVINDDRSKLIFNSDNGIDHSYLSEHLEGYMPNKLQSYLS